MAGPKDWAFHESRSGMFMVGTSAALAAPWLEINMHDKLLGEIKQCRFCGSNSVESFEQFVIASDDKSKLLDPHTTKVHCSDCGGEASLAVWQSLALPFNEASEREAFEIAAVQQFKAWRACGNIGNDNGCPASRAALCWREPDGNYGVLMLNAAWWAWRTRAQQ